jgi:hypothetical protein
MAALTANSFNALFERLTAASGEYNRAKVGELAFLDAIYLDIRTEGARKGQTIRVYFPDFGAWTDQSNNDWNPASVNPNYTDLILQQRPGASLLITDFEQLQTTTNVIDMWLDPMFKRGQEFANAQIASLATVANFPVYPPLVSANTASIDINTAANGWDILTTNKIPLNTDGANLLYHPAVHRNTLTDAAWEQESLVSAVIAETTRREAAVPGTTANQAFKFRRLFDQQAPVGAAAFTGTLGVTNGSTAISGTALNVDAPAGSYLNIAGVRYKVQSNTSATAGALAQAYQGATNATVATPTRETYTSILMHKYAIALVVAPLEIPGTPSVVGRYVQLKGLPIRVMVSYQHLHDGWLLTMDYGMVAGVLRPDFAIPILS